VKDYWWGTATNLTLKNLFQQITKYCNSSFHRIVYISFRNFSSKLDKNFNGKDNIIEFINANADYKVRSFFSDYLDFLKSKKIFGSKYKEIVFQKLNLPIPEIIIKLDKVSQKRKREEDINEKK